jgi:phosphate transport system substrate-binding protein
MGCGQKASTKISIKNRGSDTLVQVAQAWAEAYKDVAPNVSVQVSGGGSGTGITALINGTVDIANSSREIKQEERELIESRFGRVNEYIVGYDGIAVYTHRNNWPRWGRSMPKVERSRIGRMSTASTKERSSW